MSKYIAVIAVACALNIAATGILTVFAVSYAQEEPAPAPAPKPEPKPESRG